MRFILVLSISTLFVIGLIMIFSTTSAEVLDHDLDLNTRYALYRQIIFAAIGSFAVGVVRWVGYRKIIRSAPLLFGALTFVLLLVLIPGVGRVVNGSHRWISFAGFTVQPSEFAKLAIPLYFIYRLESIDLANSTFREFFQMLLPMGVPLFLILIEPDNGTVIVIGTVMLMLFALSRIPFKYWALPLMISLLIGGAFASQLPYVSARLQVYLHPEYDIQGRGHQPHQAKIAAGSGKLFGKGPGNSWQKLSYLPEAQNDYIAAIYAEEFGFIGIASLVFLYMTFAYAGFYFAHHAETLGGFYLAATLTFLIALQGFLNLGVVSGLLPSTGLNLPFFSQGGSSLIANLIAVGILLSIRDHCKKEEMAV